MRPSNLPNRAEQTKFVETSRYEDVVGFGKAIAQESRFLHISELGKSQEGRSLPLWIVADPPVSTPKEAKASGKLVLLVMANIHAGEVEGKEAAQHIVRRLTTGDLQPILKKLIVLVVPIYNADGNEKIDPNHRSQQYGPIGGVGNRENAQGLDLNRDFIKLDAPETKALVNLSTTWDPLVVVDLHTTNGSYHGYHLTYSIPLNPATDPRITAFNRARMMPALAKAMLEKFKYRSYYYGNFERRPPEPGEPPARAWYAFTHQPRIGQNYFGLRNRFAILSEAYSYLDFQKRVEVTEAFVDSILAFALENEEEIRSIASQADATLAANADSGKPGDLGVEHRPKALEGEVEILVGEVVHKNHPTTGKPMTVMVEETFKPEKMKDFGEFQATRFTSRPYAYLLSKDLAGAAVVEKLLEHGIKVEELAEPFEGEVQVFMVESTKKNPRPFQGKRETQIKGSFKELKQTFPQGSLVVRASQPLGLLAAYLLEPESDDGLTTWGFLDESIAPGKTFPISKLMKNSRLSTRLLQKNDGKTPESAPK